VIAALIIVFGLAAQAVPSRVWASWVCFGYGLARPGIGSDRQPIPAERRAVQRTAPDARALASAGEHRPQAGIAGGQANVAKPAMMISPKARRLEWS
jgi:hypothetical protein